MSSIPPPPFDPSTQSDYQGWYEMINSIVGFVTASTQLASTLRSSRSCFPESLQITELISDDQCEKQAFNLMDFPWFLEELGETSNEHNVKPEIYKTVFTDAPLVQFPLSQIANGEPNNEPRTITLIDTKDFGDISHPQQETPTFFKPIASTTVTQSAPSDQSCFFEEYTDSAQTIDSANLQVNFEEADHKQALSSGNNISFERLEEAEQLSTIYDSRDQESHLQEKLVLECDVEEILLVQHSHSKHTKNVENRDEGVETSGVCVNKELKQLESKEYEAEIVDNQKCFKRLKDVKFKSENLINYLDVPKMNQNAVEAGKPKPIEMTNNHNEISSLTKKDGDQLKYLNCSEDLNAMTHLFDEEEDEEDEANAPEKQRGKELENKSLLPLKGSPDADHKTPALDDADTDLEISSIRKLLLIMDETEDVDGKLNKEFEAVKKALELKNQLVRRFKEKCASRPVGSNFDNTPGCSGKSFECETVKTAQIIKPDKNETITKEANSKRIKATKKQLCLGKVDHITKNITNVQCRVMKCKQKKYKADLNNPQTRPTEMSKIIKPSIPMKEVVPDQKPKGKKCLSADMVKTANPANHQPTRPSSTRKQHSKNGNHPSVSDQTKPISPTHVDLLKPVKNLAEIKSCLKSVSSGSRAQKTCIIREPPTYSKKPASATGNTDMRSLRKWLPIRDTTLKMTAAQTVKKAAEMLKNAEEKVLKPTSEIKLQVMHAVTKPASSATGNR